METKTFSSNSFTYRFLAWPGDFLPKWRSPEDICELRRAVIMKIVLLTLFVGAVFMYVFSTASVGLLYLSKYFPILSSFPEDFWVIPLGKGLLIITVITASIMGLFFCVGYGFHLTQRYLQKRRIEGKGGIFDPVLKPVSSPIKAMYQSWKDKLCYKVEFN